MVFCGSFVGMKHSTYEIFKAIKRLMNKRYTRQQACNILGIDRNFIYHSLTPLQRVELDQIQYKFLQGNSPHHRGKSQIELYKFRHGIK